MNKFEKIYNEYIEKPVLKFDGKDISLYVDREDFLQLLKYGKKLEQILNKIKEEIEELGIVDCNIPNYIICISKINELLEEIK